MTATELGPIPPRVLSIAGTDPSGGAGIHADLKSIAAHGGYGMAAVTAVVAQNTRGVRAVQVLDPDLITAQLDAVSDDVEIDAVKIGMLATPEVIHAVRDWVLRVAPPAVVLDPVMVATSGDRLLDERAEEALRDLARHVDLLTPNVPEMAVLAGAPAATDWPTALEQARDLSARLDVTVLLKGGHLDDGEQVRDALVDARATDPFPTWVRPRHRTGTTHGTGCSLSAAVATLRGAGLTWADAVGEAGDWLSEAIARGPQLRVGQGAGPVHHFAQLWDRTDEQPTPARLHGQWWAQVADLREEIEGLEFVRRLGDGTLPPDVFAWYLRQDGLYLRAYSRALAQASALAPTTAEQEFWAVSARNAITAEQRMHGDYLVAGEHVEPAADTTAYVDHLHATAMRGGYDELVAAVLPCFWLYEHVGAVLHAGLRPGHAYERWLGTYADESFAGRSREAQRIVTARAAAAGAQTRARMFEVFRTSCRHERDFFAAPLAAIAAATGAPAEPRAAGRGEAPGRGGAGSAALGGTAASSAPPARSGV